MINQYKSDCGQEFNKLVTGSFPASCNFLMRPAICFNGRKTILTKGKTHN